MKIRAVTVVWGADFVDMFLRVGLRSLMADGNLPDLARTHRVVYTLHTTAADARVIEAAPAFQKLQQCVDVRISTFAATEIDWNHYGSHGVLWTRGLDLAKRNQEFLFFLIPDLLYAAGTLVGWAKRLSDGCRALYTPGPQVVLETILPELEALPSPDGLSLSVDPADISGLLLRHLHPMHCGMLRDTGRRVPFPEYDIRPVNGRGFVLRELSAQPFCMDPSYFERIVNFNPADHLNAVATGPCTTLSVEPLLKRAEWYYRPWRLDGVRISQLGAWWDYFGPPGCVKDSETAHGFCLQDDTVWQEGRAKAALSGRLFRAQMVVATQIYRAIVALRKLGLTRAATIVASALYAADLRRRAGIRAGATLFIPQDAAFDASTMDAIAQLLAPGREIELLNLIQDHVLPAGSAATALATSNTARGLSFAPVVEDVKIVSGPYNVDSFTVYVVDRVLWRFRWRSTLHGQPASTVGDVPASVCVVTQTREEALPERHGRDIEFSAGEGLDEPLARDEKAREIAGAARPLNRIATSLFGAWGYSAWAERSRLHKFFYIAMHVPIIEFAISVVFPIFFRWDLRQALVGARAELAGTAKRAIHRLRLAFSNLVRRLYLVLEPMPVFGLLARSLRRAVSLARRQGVYGVYRRVSQRMPWVEKVARSWKAMQRVRVLVRATPNYLRRNGVRATWRRAMEIARGYGHRAEASFPIAQALTQVRKIPPDMEAMLSEVRAARVLLAMEDVLQAYATSVLPSGITCAPLALTREILSKNDLLPDRWSETLEGTLNSLLKRKPTWAEAWLELGYIKSDQTGQQETALMCFARAAAGECLLDPAGGYLDPRAAAETAIARLLRTQGRLDEAVAAYSTSLALNPSQPIAAVELGRLLQRLGRYREAMNYFDAAVSYEETRSSVPKLDRDARRLAISTLIRESLDPGVRPRRAAA